MILKHILFKNFILKTIKNEFNIVNFLLLLKQIIILYIISYTQTIFNKQILIINYFSCINSHLKILNFFTNVPYITHKKVNNVITNWQMLKKQLLLLKWIIYLIYLINNNQIKLSFNNIINLVKKFIILKKNYWNIINLKNPNYILIISKEFNYNLLKKYIKLPKQIFFITMNSNIINHNSFILSTPNLACVKLIIELLILSHIQGKYFIINKVRN